MTATPRFVQARKATLYAGISATETSEIVLKNLVDAYGNALAMSDFGAIMYLTFDPGGDSEEIISVTDFTVNADGTVSLDTGIVRALSAKYAYGTGGTASAHAAGSTVVVGDNPQLWNSVIAYLNGLAIAGAANADSATKGLVETATSAEIDADTALGATGASIAVTPDQLVLSKYGVRLPSVAGAAFIAAATGMVMSTMNATAPSGFVLADGTSYDNDTYPALALVALGKWGYGTGQTFTADATSDFITATSHGLSNGDILFVTSATTLPAGLSANTAYYVIAKTTNTFQLSTSSGGAAVDITSAGTGVHTFYNNFKVPDLRGRSILGSGTGTKIATFVSRSSNVITVSGLTNAANNEFQTGQAVLYTAASGAMTGLTHNTTYYVIRVTNTTISLASTLALAQAGTAIALSSDGTGAQTFTLTLTARTLADSGGEENHAESSTEILAHTHTVGFRSGATAGSNATPLAANNDTPNATEDTSSVGGNVAMNNMQPFGVLTWIVKT